MNNSVRNFLQWIQVGSENVEEEHDKASRKSYRTVANKNFVLSVKKPEHKGT